MDTKEINAAVKCAVETTQQPPSFFIHGSSVFALETEAVKTAETLKRCENMFFRGIVKYFSIKMPYFSDMADSLNSPITHAPIAAMDTSSSMLTVLNRSA